MGIINWEINPASEAQRAYIERRGEEVAKAFHESYEKLAPRFGYETREASAKPWDSVPEQNKNLMIATVVDLMRQGII